MLQVSDIPACVRRKGRETRSNVLNDGCQAVRIFFLHGRVYDAPPSSMSLPPSVRLAVSTPAHGDCGGSESRGGATTLLPSWRSQTWYGRMLFLIRHLLLSMRFLFSRVISLREDTIPSARTPLSGSFHFTVGCLLGRRGRSFTSCPGRTWPTALLTPSLLAGGEHRMRCGVLLS